MESKPLWIEEERKCFLASFSDSSMQTDTDGVYSETRDFWRKKTYAKDEDKLLPTSLRQFPEPYQVAQHYCDGTWNDYNAPFIIQVGQCNLDCHYCFVDPELRQGKKGRYFTAKEIGEIFVQENPNHAIFRISGGEPFLAPGFIADIARFLSSTHNLTYYLWVDTNLLGKLYKETVSVLNTLLPYGVCGCFKGFDKDDFEYQTGAKGDLYDTQFKNANVLIKSIREKGQPFFYVPEIMEPMSEDNVRKKVVTFIDRLQSLHEYVPLRTTVLSIKQYNTNDSYMKKDRLESGITKKIWLEEVEKRFALDLRWLPQYQIPM